MKFPFTKRCQTSGPERHSLNRVFSEEEVGETPVTNRETHHARGNGKPAADLRRDAPLDSDRKNSSRTAGTEQSKNSSAPLRDLDVFRTLRL